MEIVVTGTNKKLLQQCGFLFYKANRAADKKSWKAYERYSEKANKKLSRIAMNLKINTSRYIVAPHKQYDRVVLIERGVKH